MIEDQRAQLSIVSANWDESTPTYRGFVFPITLSIDIRKQNWHGRMHAERENYHIHKTLFRSIIVLCGTDNIMWDWQYFVKYPSYSSRMVDYSSEYCQSRKTLLWIWIMLCKHPSHIKALKQYATHMFLFLVYLRLEFVFTKHVLV